MIDSFMIPVYTSRLERRLGRSALASLSNEVAATDGRLLMGAVGRNTYRSSDAKKEPRRLWGCDFGACSERPFIFVFFGFLWLGPYY